MSHTEAILRIWNFGSLLFSFIDRLLSCKCIKGGCHCVDDLVLYDMEEFGGVNQLVNGGVTIFEIGTSMVPVDEIRIW